MEIIPLSIYLEYQITEFQFLKLENRKEITDRITVMYFPRLSTGANPIKKCCPTL